MSMREGKAAGVLARTNLPTYLSMKEVAEESTLMSEAVEAEAGSCDLVGR
jgi:hypothetical protein